jgi:hypothetical protein
MTVETSDPSTALDLQNLRALDHRRCALYFAGGAVLKALGRWWTEVEKKGPGGTGEARQKRDL